MENKDINSNQAGKGDSPRNCFSQKYRDNFDLINWKSKKIFTNTSISDKEDYKNICLDFVNNDKNGNPS